MSPGLLHHINESPQSCKVVCGSVIQRWPMSRPLLPLRVFLGDTVPVSAEGRGLLDPGLAWLSSYHALQGEVIRVLGRSPLPVLCLQNCALFWLVVAVGEEQEALVVVMCMVHKARSGHL